MGTSLKSELFVNNLFYFIHCLYRYMFIKVIVVVVISCVSHSTPSKVKAAELTEYLVPVLSTGPSANINPM